MKEYEVVEAMRHNMESKMNDMARRGWEVVTVTPWHNLTEVFLITFSRER